MIRIVEEENMNTFVEKTDALTKDGFKILSSSCNSKKYKAILSKTDDNKKEELINFLRYVTVNYEIETESIYELEYGEQWSLENVVNEYLYELREDKENDN